MRITARTILVFALVLAYSMLLSQQGLVNTEFTALVTDRSPLALSDRFGPPSLSRLTDQGDIYLNAGSTALFRWTASAGLTRLLQGSDPHPGFPGTVCDVVGSGLVANSLGHTAMINYFAQRGVRGPRGIFVYDGARFTPVAMRYNPAPDVPNKVFDNFSQFRINNADKVAFVVGFEPYPIGGAGLFVGSPGGIPAKIAAVGEDAPSAVGGTYASLNLMGFNDDGQIAFGADIAGGMTPRAIFITTPAGIAKVAATGDPAPGTDAIGTLNLPGGGNLNSSGEIAFVSNVSYSGNNPYPYPYPFNRGIWVYSGGVLNKLVTNADDMNGLTGQYGNSITLRGFDADGEVLFSSNPAGTDYPPTPTHALFLKMIGEVASLVFKAGDPVPTRQTDQYNQTQNAQLNENGDVAFQASLQGGSIPYGWFFLGSSATTPIPVALEGQPTPAGGTYGIAGKLGAGMLNVEGKIAFLADLRGPNETAVFLWKPPAQGQAGGVQTIMTTADSIPAGANTIVRTFTPGAGDGMLVFNANKAGGRATIFARFLTSPKEEFIPIVTAGDIVPGGNGRFWLAGGSSLVNDNEEYAFQAGIVGPAYPGSGIYTWKPEYGLRKVVTTGDLAPGVQEGQFTSLSLVQVTPNRINGLGQVAFYGQTDGMTMPGFSVPSGIFVGSAGKPLTAIARSGDDSPLGGGGYFINFSSTVSLNESGTVAFRAITRQSPNLQYPGIFAGNGSAPPAKVAAQNDLIDGDFGQVNTVPSTFLLNNAGQVAYVAGLRNGTTPEAIFLRRPEDPPAPVVWVGQDVPGLVGWRFSDFREADFDLNHRGDLSFWAQITDGAAVSYGQFLRFANGQISPRLLRGQSLPGGGYASDIGININNIVRECSSLTESGELRSIATFVTGAQRMYYQAAVTPAGVVRKLLMSGDMIPGIGGGYIGLIFQMATVNSRGEYFNTVMIVEGQAKWAIVWNGTAKKK